MHPDKYSIKVPKKYQEICFHPRKVVGKMFKERLREGKGKQIKGFDSKGFSFTLYSTIFQIEKDD